MNRARYFDLDSSNRESGGTRPIIGYYGFWVKLTYLSVISAVCGIHFALGGKIGHAIICLMISGLCDMFDGTVARLKKRNDREKSYGIQIDALADMVCFGVLPAMIGYAALTQSDVSTETIINMGIASVYVLTALIRLAFFNVIEIELQSKKIRRTHYEGLPVTSVAIVIPMVYAVCLYFEIDWSTVYYKMLVVLSIAFVARIKVPKLKIKQLLVFMLIGLPVITYLIWKVGTR